MDFNEYAMAELVRQRHEEMLAAAVRRGRLADAGWSRRRALRAVVGETLIRLGAWLLRESYATP